VLGRCFGLSPKSKLKVTPLAHLILWLSSSAASVHHQPRNFAKHTADVIGLMYIFS